MTLAHREALLKMLARVSFRLGEFKLSSGATSDYYIDGRTTTVHSEGAVVHSRAEDAALARAYADLYEKAGGPQIALVKQWLGYLEKKQ